MSIKFLNDSMKLNILLGEVFVVCVLMVIGLWAIFSLPKSSDDKNVVAEVGSVKITKSDLKKAVDSSSASKEDKEANTNVILDKMVENEVARQSEKDLLGAITDKEVEEWLTKNGLEKTDDNKKAAKSEILKVKIIEKDITWVEGSAVVFRYDRYLQSDVFPDAAKNAELKKKAEDYIATKLPDVLARLKSGALTVEAAIEEVGSDATIGKPAWAPYNIGLGQKVVRQDSIEKGYMSSYPEFWTNFFSVAEKTYTQKDVMKQEEGQNRKIMSVIYYVTAKGTGTFGSFEEWLTDAKTKLNTRVYYDRAKEL